MFNRPFTTTEEADLSCHPNEIAWMDVNESHATLTTYDGQDEVIIWAIGDNLYAGHAKDSTKIWTDENLQGVIRWAEEHGLQQSVSD